MAAVRSRKAFEEAVGKALRQAPAPYDATVLAAVSGGADSTALLLSLDAVSRSGRIKVAACYVDHGLRPESEIAQETGSLQALCNRVTVPLLIERAELAAVPAGRGGRKRSVEEVARIARYEALRRAAEQMGAWAIATGHTADDQAETVLLRALRGSGVRGLAGIRQQSRPWGGNGPLLLRPLLFVRRCDTEAYCGARGVECSSDSTNASDRFRRNRVRAELLPVAEAIAPGAALALSRLAEQAGAFGDLLERELDALEERLVRVEDGGLALVRPAPPLPAYLASALIARLLGRLMEGPGAPSERVVQAAVGMWLGPRGRRAALGRGWTASAEADKMVLTRAE